MSGFRIPNAVHTICALLAVLVGIAACGEDPVAPSPCGSLPQVTVNVGETVTVTACFEDVNGDMLSYSVTSSNPSVATASASGPSITVRAIAPGNATVTVTAQDPGGLSGQQSFPAMVPNRPPLPRGSIPATEVAAGKTATVDASSYFTEPDGEALTYSVVSSDPSVVTASVGGNNVTVTGVTKGTTNVTITATDPGGLSANQTFQATVPNQPPRPVGTIPARTVEVGVPATLDVSQYFDDPDGDLLTYTAASSNSRVATVAAAGASVTVTAVARGRATVTVTATDPDRLTATQTFQVTVPNRPPRRRGTIPAQTVTDGQTETVNVSSYFTDPDGDALTYSASSSNTGVARVSASGNTVRITAVAPGTANVTVTGRDSEGASVQQSFRVTVTRANRAPQRVGTIPAQTITQGRTGTVNVSSYFTDPDGDALTYSASSSNTGVARVSVSGSTATISAVAAGTATVTVTARDPGGLTATQTASVTVSQANRPPQSRGTIPAQTITQGRTATVNVSSYFTDPDGDALTYSALSSNTGVARVSVSGSTATISAVAVGTATVTVTARDPGGLTATQTVSVTVSQARAPNLVFASVSPRTATATVPPADTIDVEVVIRNAGNADAAATNIRFFQSNDATITRSDREIGNPSALRALRASEEVQTDWFVRIPANFTPQTIYVGWCVDAVPGESNTGDNCSPSVRITVTAAASLTRLTFHNGDDSHPDWCAVGGSRPILFESDRDDDIDIFAMRDDGSGVRNLTFNTALDQDPAWSPDCKLIAFVSDRDGDRDVFVMRDDGSDPTNLTFQSVYAEDDPAWSPDGGQIAFVSDRDGLEEIYVMDADGSGVRRLTNRLSYNDAPAWSPDGGQIAFSASASNESGIYVVNASGSGVTRLTNDFDHEPAWSPDGRRIAFSRVESAGVGLYVMNANGSGVTRLSPANRDFDDLQPAWTPGGAIVFTSNRDGNYEIYVMSVPGAGAGQQQAGVVARSGSDATISVLRRR